MGEAGQTWSFRGSKSRNKVTVGEPAVGSLEIQIYLNFEMKSIFLNGSGLGTFRQEGFQSNSLGKTLCELLS